MSNEDGILKGVCNTKKTTYRNGKSFEQCKEEATIISRQIAQEVQNKGEVSWSYLLEFVKNDELLYKLTLKYLKQKGYDIGNNKVPRVKNSKL
ncbi:MAG: hypothetical protein MRJ93_03670 [Nitrososphaeraceae archaeon]|nr:hypothetical protein [Nitrososphaeraceae archaeon]